MLLSFSPSFVITARTSVSPCRVSEVIGPGGLSGSLPCQRIAEMQAQTPLDSVTGDLSRQVRTIYGLHASTDSVADTENETSEIYIVAMK